MDEKQFILGNEIFTVRHPGIKKLNTMRKQALLPDSKTFSVDLFHEQVLQHVVVAPLLSFDQVDEWFNDGIITLKQFNFFMSEIMSFLYSKMDNSYYKQLARENWGMWRLVFDQNSSVTYTEAQAMDIHTILEANAALDMMIEKLNKANKGK